MKHVSFDPPPVIPLLFLLHERELTNHACMFRTHRDLVFKLKNVPILIDKGPGIKKAIHLETDLKIVGCWRHLKPA